MQTEQTTKPEDAYMLERWNVLANNNYEADTAKSFRVALAENSQEVSFGLIDLDEDMAVVKITPDQARAIATMLVYAAQEAEK